MNKKVILGFGALLLIDYYAMYASPYIWKFLNLQKGRVLSPGTIVQATFFIVTIVAILLMRRKFSEFGFKLINPKKLIRPALQGLATSLCFFILGIIVKIVLSSGDGPDGDMPKFDWVSTIVKVWIIASWCEEIFYRGLMQTWLDPWKKYGFNFFKAWISLPSIISGAVFGISHLCLLNFMPVDHVIQIVISGIVLGIMAGYHREKTGSLLPAYIVHLSFNIVGSVIPFILMNLG